MGRAEHSARRQDGVFQALATGVRMMLERPALAGGMLIATISQGVLQGLLVLALRRVLLGFSSASGATAMSLTLGALLIYALWLFRAAASGYSDVLSNRLADSVEIAGVKRLLRKLLSLSARFFDKTRQEDIILAPYHDLKSLRNITLSVGELCQHGSRLAGLVVVAFLMSPKLAAVGLIVGPLGLLPAHWFGQKLVAAAGRQREAVSALSYSFLQITGAIRLIKVNRGEERVWTSAAANADEYQRFMEHATHARATSRFLFEAVSGLGLVLVLTLGGRDVASGALSWQSLLSLLIAIVAVYAPMLGLLNVYATMQSNRATLDRVNHILRSVPEIQDAPHARRLIAPPDVIELRNVSFSYGDRESLHGVSATIHRGETIGIVGPSGAGKSTLLSLLLRFYDPTGGAVLFDGVDIRQLRHADLIDASALVQQDSFLLGGTIADNIRFGRPDATMAEVTDAGRAANLHDEVMEMERGYDTVLGYGPSARGLSGGQRQRVCIAAALLKNAPILLLDEATSSLDSVSEAAVQGAINRLMEGRTTFVIAHRLSTLRNADRILVLDEGRVVGLGTHRELLENSPTYRALWAAQRAGLPRTDGAHETAMAASESA